MEDKKLQPSLTQRVEMIASGIELLLETLKDLSYEEFEEFKSKLHPFQIQFMFERTDSQLTMQEITDLQDTVFSMVQTFGQMSVENTKKVLKKMKRTDLVQRLSNSSSGAERKTKKKKKHSVDEHLSALIHKVATMASVKELLLETLNDLNCKKKTFKWLLQFTLFKRNLPQLSWERLKWADTADLLVDVMVEKYGQQSVEVAKEVFMDMNRMDLVQRLSETSSGLKAAESSTEALGVNTTEREKHSVDEHWPALTQKVVTMASVIELLLETLIDLKYRKFKEFKEILRQIHFPSFRKLGVLETMGLQDTVFLLVQTFGQRSVETTKEVLKKIKRTDLDRRLSDSSAGSKKKSSTDEQRSALIQKVATMAAVKQLLLETLNDLSNEELKKLKRLLKIIFSQKDLQMDLRHTADRAEIVDLMMETYSQQSVELTREVFMDLNRTDLVQRLSKPSSGLEEKPSVDEHRPTLLERVSARAAVRKLLFETLNALSFKELEKFKFLLQFTYFQKSLPQISKRQMESTHSAEELVDLMVENLLENLVENQQSVEVTKEVFMDMDRTDLVQRLSETSSGLKENHQSEPPRKEITMTSLFEKLLETLEDLSSGDLEQFKHVAQYMKMKEGLPRISRHQMEMADGRDEIVELMVKLYGQQCVEVTREVLKKLNRTDLVERLSDISSGSKEGPSRSLELKGCGSSMQDSSDWTKLEPEGNSTDADEAPSYSLQTEAGKFECSVSGLRWFCKEKVSFKYQFCSWE